MPRQSLRHLSQVSLCALLGFAAASFLPARADLHAMAEEAHHDLQQALNPGGDPPGDADRTALLKSALEILKDLPPMRYGLARVKAESSIRSALLELKNGASTSQVTDDIRDADSAVRDIESL